MSRRAGLTPLAGRSVVVTRATEQAGPLVEQLAALGAEVVEVPVITTVPPPDGGAALSAALAGLRAGDWLAVTSANGAAALGRAPAASEPGTDAGAPSPEGNRPADLVAEGVRVAAVGPATAAALRTLGIGADLVPAVALADVLAEELCALPPARIVVAQAGAARPTLVERLRAAGWDVTPVVAYVTVPAPPSPAALARAAAADAITFTSGSTIDAYLATDAPVPPVVVCIGPVAAAAARARGLVVTAVAEPHTTSGLVAAVARTLGP